MDVQRRDAAGGLSPQLSVGNIVTVEGASVASMSNLCEFPLNDSNDDRRRSGLFYLAGPIQAEQDVLVSGSRGSG